MNRDFFSSRLSFRQNMLTFMINFYKKARFMTKSDTPVYRLEDYSPTDYAISNTELDFSLHPTETIVKSKLSLSPRKNTKPGTPLVLVGDELKLLSVAINGQKLEPKDYSATPDKLEIHNPPSGKFFLFFRMFFHLFFAHMFTIFFILIRKITAHYI